MLPAEHRLSHRRDITSALRRGRRRGTSLLVVHRASSDRPGPARAAFAVSSAVGNSVIRHRLTRQLRAAVLPLLRELPAGTDVVIRALPPAKDASFTQLQAALEQLLGVAVPAISPVSEEPPHPSGPPRSGFSLALYWLGAPLRLILIGLVMAYRRVISPVLPPTCRYHPSCSAYALDSLQTHGVVKGVALAGWRLLRCNPFTAGGLDPVPERGSWRPSIHPDGSPREPGAVGLPDDRGVTTPITTSAPRS